MRREAHGSAGGQIFGCRHKIMKGAGRQKARVASTLGIALALLGHRAPAQSVDSFPQPHTTYGGIGMIEMPSARMVPDGQLSASFSFSNKIQKYNLNFQALPWLNTSFRYSILHTSKLDSSNSQYYDRSFGVKIRLSKEGIYRPEISLGVRDIIGSGIYSSEYIVATKRIFRNFDVSLGLGWGRLATADGISNPFKYILKSFSVRSNYAVAGGFNTNVFFHGPNAGIFGGVAWKTPIPHLSLTTEYSSDRYVLESSHDFIRPKIQVNFGAQYQLSDTVQIGAEWLYGESAGLTLTFTGDPTKPIYKSTLAPRPIPRSIRSPEQQLEGLKELMKPLQAAEYNSHSKGSLPSMNLATFTAAIFRRPNNVRGIEIHGADLEVSTKGLANEKMCRWYAQAVSGALRGIDEVTIHSTRKSTLRCAVPGAAMHQWDSTAGITIAPVLVTDTTGLAKGNSRTHATNKTIDDAIHRDASDQLLFIDKVEIKNGVATVYYENGAYESAADAAGRLIRVLMKDTPSNVEDFRMISMVDGLPAQEYDVLRSPMERAIEQSGGIAEINEAVNIHHPPMHPQVLEQADDKAYPRFVWSLSPSLKESFFNPQNPLRAGLFASLGGEFRLTPQLAITASTSASIWNNLVSGRPDNSLLPHVRSDFEKYYRYGANGISSLMMSYRWRITPDITALVKGGYLESMYGGFGGEVLWHPETSRFAVGVDLYQVWKRNFDRLFGFQKYHVLTGHLSLYYQSPWHNLDFKLMYGRYLARDHGFTLEIFRRFSTGVEVGAFMTLTNVSAAQFGEGSFDKGFIVRIPFDWLLPIPSQSEYSIDLRPVTRDGGQRLSGDTVLYNVLQRESYGHISNQLGLLANP